MWQGAQDHWSWIVFILFYAYAAACLATGWYLGRKEPCEDEIDFTEQA